MDTIFTQLVNAGTAPPSGTASTPPPGRPPARSPTWRRPTRTRPSPPSTTSDGRHATRHARGDPSRPGARRHPGRRAVRAALAVRRHVPDAAHRGPCRRPRARPEAASDRHLLTDLRAPATTRHSRWRSPTTVSRLWESRRRRWTASPRSSAKGWRRAPPCWGTSVRAAPSTGSRRSAAPTCTWPSRFSRRTLLGSRLPPSRRGGPTPSCPGWRWSGVRTATSSPPDGPPSASRTASASPRSKEAAGPPRVPGSDRSRPARSSWATPTRPASCRRCRRRRSWVATAPTSSSASCTPRWRPTDATCATGRRPVRRRTSSARRWSGAGRAVLRSPSHRTATTPSSAPMRGATTTSSSPTTRAGSSARWVPTPGGPTRATPWTRTAAWTSGCTA